MAGHLPGRGFESLPESLSVSFPPFLSLYFFLSLWLWLRLRSDCQVWSMLISECHAPRASRSLHTPPNKMISLHCVKYFLQPQYTENPHNILDSLMWLHESSLLQLWSALICNDFFTDVLRVVSALWLQEELGSCWLSCLRHLSKLLITTVSSACLQPL